MTLKTTISGGVALVAAALGSAHVGAAEPAIPAGSTYVSLGSSYAAGPAVSEKAGDSLGPCNQSRDNYARQLARRRGFKLIDRSCGGATTVDVVRGGQFGLAPQLDGLTPDTRLVTITIGGNDVRYTADLGAAACAYRASQSPAAASGACPSAPASFDMEQGFATAAANLRTIAAEVRRRSPQARLIFVDYVTVLPAGAPCAAVSLPTAEAAALRERADRLARLTAEVAADTGAGLVKASELTRDHNACAADPWAQGYALKRNPTDWGPAAFHPLLPAMTAIAEKLDAMLGG